MVPFVEPSPGLPFWLVHDPFCGLSKSGTLGGLVVLRISGGDGAAAEPHEEEAEDTCRLEVTQLVQLDLLWCILPRDVRILTFCQPMDFPLNH